MTYFCWVPLEKNLNSRNRRNPNVWIHQGRSFGADFSVTLDWKLLAPFAHYL